MRQTETADGVAVHRMAQTIQQRMRTVESAEKVVGRGWQRRERVWRKLMEAAAGGVVADKEPPPPFRHRLCWCCCPLLLLLLLLRCRCCCCCCCCGWEIRRCDSMMCSRRRLGRYGIRVLRLKEEEGKGEGDVAAASGPGVCAANPTQTQTVRCESRKVPTN
ncbi:hypothetical protein DFJ73DRAFT_231740 [Zopfochytrium polystomum]|nr:hypothetical protein DFJ73DRAFT_231740 [Zopfochytrium polystomum]